VVGGQYITTKADCDKAAIKIEWNDITAVVAASGDELNYPPGCYKNNSANSLRFNGGLDSSNKACETSSLTMTCLSKLPSQPGS
jgi:hypothetical protein